MFNFFYNGRRWSQRVFETFFCHDVFPDFDMLDDTIDAGNGDNAVFGGVGADTVTTGSGADVISIEKRDGNTNRSMSAGPHPELSGVSLNLLRNKRSVVIDLKTEEGRDLLLRMAPHYDVFVENYGPGVIESLDIGYDVMRERNPRLIYGRIKGFGLSGPYARSNGPSARRIAARALS